ncbi:MAG: sulfite exporter TauE/SafE family protein [Rhodospirillales bacterium]|nr:sulfite exporter TauE/SafE family protein [Rhodospirillales bacterium]
MIPIGMLAGFMAGLLGVGGGIILVPALHYLFIVSGYGSDAMMHMAVGTSLAVIIPTGLSSVRAHWHRGAVRLDLLKAIGPGILLGVIGGTFIAGVISGADLKAFFSVALIGLALLMLLDPARFTPFLRLPPQPVPVLTGSVIGVVSTLMGIGGATLSVPFMRWCRVDMKEAVATASALGVIIAIPATAGFLFLGWQEKETEILPPLSLGFVNGLAWAVLVPASVVAAPWGARAAHALPVQHLRKLFAFLIAVLAVRMSWEVWFGG